MTGLQPGEGQSLDVTEEERALMERLKAHDRTALDQVYALHADGVYRYALYQLGDWSAAEDVVSEVFLRLLKSIDHYEYRGVPLRAYLFRIARNLAVDQQRKLGRLTALESVPEQRAHSANPAVLAEQQLGWDELRTTMQHLTEEQRQVLLLRFVEGMDCRQVAQVIGRSEASVKALQHRALGSMRRILERQGHEH
jgi:RNA polymerase sigma-70 factor, ECF subfamily